MKTLSHNRRVNMLTATSILENLPSKRFASYKTLLLEVASYWQDHAARLPSEIGPKDVVVRAASLHLIRRNSDGTVEIVISRSRSKSSRQRSKKVECVSAASV